MYCQFVYLVTVNLDSLIMGICLDLSPLNTVKIFIRFHALQHQMSFHVFIVFGFGFGTVFWLIFEFFGVVILVVFIGLFYSIAIIKPF